jgi:hypothetical protein
MQRQSVTTVCLLEVPLVLKTEVCLARPFPHPLPDHPHAEVFFRFMNGSSQPVLVQASDGRFYVLKFANNPQGPNTLFNEAFGSILAQYLGLPVPSWRPIRLNDDFIDKNPNLGLASELGLRLPSPGLHFGSCFILGLPDDEVYDIVPSSWLRRVENPALFGRMMLLDIWAENVDRRQALFIEHPGCEGLDVVFFDHGHMFGGPHGDKRLQSTEVCLYYNRKIYERAFRSARMGPWLALIENTGEATLRMLLDRLPSEWRDSALEDNAIMRLMRNQRSLRQRAREMVSKVPC